MEPLDILLAAVILAIAWALANDDDSGGKRSRGQALAGSAA